jgi:hypothetical protein
MRALLAGLLLGILGCRQAPLDAEDALDRCVDALLHDPWNLEARAALPFLLRAVDDREMAEMRAYHGTSTARLRHLYPTHAWIHPFLRGCRQQESGLLTAAEPEFWEALEAARADLSSALAIVVAAEAGLRLSVLREEALPPGRAP